MTTTLPTSRRSALPPLFGLLAAAVLGLGRYAVTRPGVSPVVGVAVALDLTLTLPLLYYLTLVRGLRLPRPTVVAVMVLGAALSPLVFAGAQVATPGFVAWIGAAGELALLWMLVRGLRRARRRLRGSARADRLRRFREAAVALVGDNRAADILAYEASVLWYALLSWGRPVERSGAGWQAFGTHRRSGYTALVVALMMAIAAEVAPIHLVVAGWSRPAAWILTALSLYGALWLVGDLRAVRLRPIEVDGSTLRARLGLRWWLEVEASRIRELERIVGSPDPPSGGELRMALPGAPRVRIVLAGPVQAHGPYGLRRRVECLVLGVDEPERFIDSVARGMDRSG